MLGITGKESEMKKVYKGWVGNSQKNPFVWWTHYGETNLDLDEGTIFKTKGTRNDWLEDWPPKRITVTVEME